MPEENKDEWYIRISPHFWFINIKGEIVRPPYPAVPGNPIEPEPKKEIDINFAELKGSIKFAFMGSGQYTQNRFFTRFNVVSLVLAGEVITPLNLIIQDAFLRFEYLSGDISLGYDVLKKPKVNLYVLGGLKFIYFDISAETNLLGKFPIEGAREKFLVDPVIGAYLRYRPMKWLELNGYSDFGLVVGNDVSAQFMGGANFFITQWFYIAGGYRFWYLKVPKEEAIFNGHIRGSMVKIGFQLH